ncbi:TetR/AcrR family transcriptional regulator [Paractinoplanes hotanensis]|uniref:TetR/AcrR family transcriptional regulator n=1 Tax=Paractinoplanes hotanensis TaxID=2906497 RepID=A0ABT0YBL9_9ACTN|nr:TetR/AcrR family transcriptional regulator [Actinoplanes hotanensis]MCM4083453.1 TetR/AcrR family transcriptional regulator [Actinoplanes hotanensis]
MTTRDTSRAAANRRRILDVALAELLHDPDASMDQIARAAGVVRRTVYGHFPSREALVGALLDGAVEMVAAARATGLEGVTDPAESLARATLAAWQVADRYRILIALAQRSVTVQGIRDRLAPVREASLETLQRGLDQGMFTSPLSARALMFLHEQMLIALMEAVNDGLLRPSTAGSAAAVAILTVSGVPTTRATQLVARLGAGDGLGATGSTASSA